MLQVMMLIQVWSWIETRVYIFWFDFIGSKRSVDSPLINQIFINNFNFVAINTQMLLLLVTIKKKYYCCCCSTKNFYNKRYNQFYSSFFFASQYIIKEKKYIFLHTSNTDNTVNNIPPWSLSVQTQSIWLKL